MFKENKQHNQLSILNSTSWMSPRIVKKLAKTWAPIFYEHVFCKIDEKLFALLYSDIGRPNFPINIILSLEYIKHMFGYTDDELIDNFYFNYLVNYALGIKTIGEINMAERTLYEFRERVYRYALAHPGQDELIFKQFIHLTEGFAKTAGISTKEQRMDSTLIMSNIKKAGRLSLAFDVLEQAVKAIPEEYLSESLKEILKPEYKTNILFRIKADETSNKLEIVLNICSEAAKIVESKPELENINAVKILKRFLLEQAEYDTEKGCLKSKDKIKIESNSLQSAYDEDATYRTKARKSQSGYVVNLAETCSSDNDIQLITDYKVDKNIKSDVELIHDRIPVIKQNTDCEEMYTDGGYYSENIIKAAEKENINMHYTDMTGKQPNSEKLPVKAFTFDDKFNVITSCPKDQEPVHSASTNSQIVAHFNKETCDNCELRDKCRIKQQKKDYVVRISKKAITAEAQRVEIKKYIKENTSKRAAIEGTNSALKRCHGIGKLKVRGIHKCNIVSGLKITAHNFKMFVRHMENIVKDGFENRGIAMPI